MRMIKQQDGKFIAELNRSIYSKGSIDRAMKDFSKISRIKRIEKKSAIALILPGYKFLTGLELCNYVLGLEKIKLDRLTEEKNESS